jgi:predicted lipoprotein with Yx(FWY)xxD motif
MSVAVVRIEDAEQDVKVINRLDGTADRVVLRGEALRRWMADNRPGPA